MKFFKNLSIRFKIMIPVAIMGIVTIAVGAVGLLGTNRVLDAGEKISEDCTVCIEQIGEISASYQSLRRAGTGNDPARGNHRDYR